VTSPRNASSRGGKRFYSWRDESFWSVTTIISGGLPKPALINWAKKFTAEFAVSNFEALTALVESDPDGAVDWLKGAAYRERDRKADLGTYLHAAMEAHSLGKPFPEWPAQVRPRMEAFLRFCEQHDPKYIATEASVYNRTQRYAGTLDAIVELGGRRYVLDMKSSKDIYPDVALQLAAYRHAEFIGLPDGSEAPMHDTDGAVALHLADGEDGAGEWKLLEVDAGEDVFRFFLYVREVFRWQEERAKTVLLGHFPCTLESAAMALGEVA
jgi:hypothetical protein